MEARGLNGQARMVVRALAQGGLVGLVYKSRDDLRDAMGVVRPLLGQGLAGTFNVDGRCRVNTEHGGRLVPVQFGKTLRGVRFTVLWMVGQLDLSDQSKMAWMSGLICAGATVLPFNAFGVDRRVDSSQEALDLSDPSG